MMDTARLQADWLIIWKSEAVALAADREVAEAQARLLDAALRDRAAVARLPVSRPVQATRTASAGAAPDARGGDNADLAELRARLEQLECRLDGARR